MEEQQGRLGAVGGGEQVLVEFVTSRASLVAQMVKKPPAMQEAQFYLWVRKIPWRREWQPTPVFLPGESRGQRSLVGCSPWGHEESAGLSD